MNVAYAEVGAVYLSLGEKASEDAGQGGNGSPVNSLEIKQGPPPLRYLLTFAFAWALNASVVKSIGLDFQETFAPNR
ncbi:hypothetical protein [Pararhodospirillum photometricum]|uniref:hypothetical protein n=1 Tax=Pararhodospirillum photometricum TaxID=1084 RepID=UPI0012FEDB74|nr:hypothetical protein [Pararhodospirillum photometricum]